MLEHRSIRFVSCETVVSRSIFLNYVCTSTSRDLKFFVYYDGEFYVPFYSVQLICMYVIFLFFINLRSLWFQHFLFINPAIQLSFFYRSYPCNVFCYQHFYVLTYIFILYKCPLPFVFSETKYYLSTHLFSFHQYVNQCCTNPLFFIF
jgi:hypothetical protein